LKSIGYVTPMAACFGASSTIDKNRNHALMGQLMPSAHVLSPEFARTAATSVLEHQHRQAPGAAGPRKH
jgi:hypothetical protein